jgi:hypothetical protein
MFKKTVFNLSTAAVLGCCAVAAFAGSAYANTEGAVLETMDAAGYTYMFVDSGTSRQWVAIPQNQVAVGEKIVFADGMVMNNFHSKTLDRTFESVIFSPGLASAAPSSSASTGGGTENSFAAAVAKEQQAPAAPTMPAMSGNSGGSSGAVVPFADINVAKASGENSYTVEELFTKAKELNGKSIRLQAKVVKFSPNIMGRNWIHLQDGTGNPMQNSHDLVVTTAETVNVNEVVTIEGILAAEKDFGAGYKYDAIVEQAKVIR